LSAKAKPKRTRVRPEDLEILDAKAKIGGKTVTVHGDGPEPKAADNGKIRRRRNPANKIKKKAKTANELMLEAWKYSWENRNRRLTKT
jgi:hypothetical protein